MYRTPSEELRVALLDYSRERKRSLSQKKHDKARKQKEAKVSGQGTKEAPEEPIPAKPVNVKPIDVTPPVPPKRESRSRSIKSSKTVKSNKVNLPDVPQPETLDSDEIHYANEPNIDSTGKSDNRRTTDSLCSSSVDKDHKSKGAFSAVKDWFVETFTYSKTSIAKKVNELNSSTSPEAILITALHPTNSLGVANSAGSIIDSQAQLVISQTDAQIKPNVTASSASTSTLKNADFVVDDEFEQSESSLGTTPEVENCFFSSMPRYVVPLILKDGNSVHQTRFLQKIFALLVMKALFILAWLCVVYTSKPLQELYRDTRDYHVISAGTYIIIKGILRVAPAIRKCNMLFHAILYIVEILATLDMLGFVLSTFVHEHFTIITNILYCLIATGTFFIVVGYSVKYDIVDGIMLGSALVVTCIMWLHQIFHYSSVGKGGIQFKGSVEEMLSTLCVFAVSEIYIALTMYELKSVLTGYRFAPEPRDWLFTSVFSVI